MASPHISGRILKASGDSEDFYTDKETPSLKEMQQAVNGYIERVRLPANATLKIKGLSEPCVMIVNEEGLPRRLPVNLEASMIAQCHIVGDVIIMPSRLFK